LSNITLEQAETVIDAGKAAAAERGEKVAMAVIDAGGNMVAFAKQDGTRLITIDTAIGKAVTAVSMGFDTVDLNPYIAPGQPLFGTGLALSGLRSFVPYAGGVVIRDRGGDVLGALGVSGAAASETDHEIGTEAVAKLA
jgi:uncharacterized protein GlcG (DUF336 family)